MNQNTAYRKNNARSSSGRTSTYVSGNTARKLYEQSPERRDRNQELQPVVRKNRAKAHYMSAGYVLFLAAALCICAYILFNYIQLQAELTSCTRENARKETQLNNMKVANDENYNRIVSSIDLEKIKSIAIGELGMVYANEGQIVLYTSEGTDSMRKVVQND